MAFTQNTVPTFLKQPTNGGNNILPATGTGSVTLYTAGANGSKIMSMLAQNTDAASHLVYCNATLVGPGSLSLPMLFNTLVAANSFLDLMNPALQPHLRIDSDGNPYIFLMPGQSLVAGVTVAMAASTFLAITIASAGDF